MNSRNNAAAFLIVAMTSACSRSASAPAKHAVAPKVDRNRIAFAPDAPQLGYVHSEPAPERDFVASNVNGRLAWDEDMTTRVFPSVSGRIVSIRANPGQQVAAHGVLALIKSAAFGQAQADVLHSRKVAKTLAQTVRFD